MTLGKIPQIRLTGEISPERQAAMQEFLNIANQPPDPRVKAVVDAIYKDASEALDKFYAALNTEYKSIIIRYNIQGPIKPLRMKNLGFALCADTHNGGTYFTKDSERISEIFYPPGREIYLNPNHRKLDLNKWGL